ncbi:MAG TPA: metal ABC transporter permease [Chloroflexota bacterium]|nr:metal ABC transporter permease [Chloroflexota bacterium]
MTPVEALRAALVDPLAYAFMRNGLLEVVLLGVACGLVGVFVVHQRLTFFGHALSHTVFPALVVATALRVDLTLAALVGTAATIGLVLALRAQRDVGDDSAVGIVFIGLLALGVVLIGLLRIRSQLVADVLVGDVLGVSAADLTASAGLVVLVGSLVLALYRPLVLVAFDRGSARAIGLPVFALDLLLLGLVAATATVGVRVVGVVLTVAVLVAPAATALLWVRRVPSAMALATAIAAGAGVLGLYLTYHVPIAPGSVLVLLLTVAFVASALLGPRGILRRRRAG